MDLFNKKKQTEVNNISPLQADEDAKKKLYSQPEATPEPPATTATPIAPANPINPISPVNPVTPAAPINPINPVPQNMAAPANPVAPAAPVTPINPAPQNMKPNMNSIPKDPQAPILVNGVPKGSEARNPFQDADLKSRFQAQLNNPQNISNVLPTVSESLAGLAGAARPESAGRFSGLRDTLQGGSKVPKINMAPNMVAPPVPQPPGSVSANRAMDKLKKFAPKLRLGDMKAQAMPPAPPVPQPPKTKKLPTLENSKAAVAAAKTKSRAAAAAKTKVKK